VASNLKRQKLTYFARYSVPRSLRAVIGRSEILRTLKTQDKREADKRKHRVLAELQEMVSRLAVEATLPKDTAEYVLATARTLREAVVTGESTEENAQAALNHALDHHLETLARKNGIDGATGDPLLTEAHERTLRLAHQVLSHGNVTLLSESVAKYLKEIKPRITGAAYKQKDKQLHAFAKWLGEVDVATITRRVTGRYVADVVQAADLASKTKKDWIANLTAFGSWLTQYGLTEFNPWSGLTRAIRESTRGGSKPEKRPYTPKELVKLLGHLKPGSPLLPLACIAAYSGCRIEELASMQVDHITDDALRVMEGKNANSVRYVPLHDVIKPMVRQLCRTSTDGYLISGLLPGGVDNKRSHYVSKRFGDLLRRNEFPEGEVDFHSFRRSFAQRCEQAGLPQSTAALLLGHARQSLTYGLYSPGPEFEALQVAMEKVTYGEPVDSRVRALTSRAAVTVRSTRRRVRRPLVREGRE
jgi:integrase